MLWNANKGLWFGGFLLSAVAFVLIVLPTAMEETMPEQVFVWYLVTAVVGLLAFGLWGYFVLRARRFRAVEESASR